MTRNPERIPVIVGVGQVNDRPADPRDGMDPVALMAEALRRAERDAGGDWLSDCQSLAVIGQIGWPQLNPVDGAVARALGMAPAHSEQTSPHGDNPVRMLNEAANRIGRGEAQICAVTGAEALRTAGQLARLQPAAANTPHDPLRNASHRRRAGYAQSHGLVVPTDVYPLYENALRAAEGQTLEQGQAESGAIWAQFSQIADANPAAWLHQPRSAAEITTPGPDNRLIAFPYTKLQVANAGVNQGAGFIVTSLAEAHRRGVEEERLIHIGYGASAFEPEDVLARDRYDRSAGMEVSIRRTMALNGVAAGDLTHVELYSCFPCVPKMARRILDWPLDRPASVFGGLTFGGGPIGNYMSHAIASMADALRTSGGRGLLFANGGYATHNHTILLSAQPLDYAAFPQDFDYQTEADALRGPVPPLNEGYSGPATIETYTVYYGRDGAPRSAVIVARTPAGARVLAQIAGEDAAAITALTDGLREPVGREGVVTHAARDGLAQWAMELP